MPNRTEPPRTESSTTEAPEAPPVAVPEAAPEQTKAPEVQVVADETRTAFSWTSLSPLFGILLFLLLEW